MEQLIKWNQNVVKESLRIPTSIRQTKMVILQALRRTLIWDYRELNLGSAQCGNWTRLGESGLQVQRSKSEATLPPTIFYIMHSQFTRRPNRQEKNNTMQLRYYFIKKSYFSQFISRQTASSLSFSSDLGRGVHARASVERRSKIICESRAFCAIDQEKRGTARSLI